MATQHAIKFSDPMSYLINDGKYQDTYNKFYKTISNQDGADSNDNIELLRIASQMYHGYYDNGDTPYFTWHKSKNTNAAKFDDEHFLEVLDDFVSAMNFTYRCFPCGMPEENGEEDYEYELEHSERMVLEIMLERFMDVVLVFLDRSAEQPYKLNSNDFLSMMRKASLL